MKKKVLSFALALSMCLVLCIGFSIPSYAIIGDSSGDTGLHNAHIGGGNVAPRVIYVVNNDNELWSLKLSEDGAITQNKLLDGVKEVAAAGLSYDNLTAVMMDGRLLYVDLTFGGESVNAETVVATDAKSLVTNIIKAQEGYYINNKNELCYWNGSTTTVIDTNVREGTATSLSRCYYIKNDNTLWKLDTRFEVPTKELILEDVKWFAGWRELGELYDTCFAIRTDGSLWGWGNTSYGDLGVSEFSTITLVDSGGGGISVSRKGVHCYVEAPTKILDGVDKLFRDIYGQKESGSELRSYNAVMKDGTVISWGGELYETNPNSWNHVRKAEKQWLSTVEQIVNYSYAAPYQLVQYKDGKLTLSEIGGLYVFFYGKTYTSTARTVSLDMMLQGYNGNSTVTPDTPSTWAAEQVNAAIAAGIVPEALQSKYTQATTRAEFCALAVALYETATGKEIAGRSTFSDTTDVNVQKMASLGVVAGVGDNKFSPDTSLTREQAAAMLSRLAGVMNKPMPEQSPTFADNGKIGSWAYDAVGHVQAAGIMSGVGNNQFSPSTAYTREQSIVTMLRMFDYVK